MIIYCSNLHCPCDHPWQYADEWFSSTCMHISHLYAYLSSHRTIHVKSYSWILRACVGETCFCMNHLGYSPMLDIAQCLIILDINCTCCQPIVYAMHTINPSHAILQWCNRGSIRSLERSDSRQLIATWCTMIAMMVMMTAMMIAVMYSFHCHIIIDSFLPTLEWA